MPKLTLSSPPKTGNDVFDQYMLNLHDILSGLGPDNQGILDRKNLSSTVPLTDEETTITGLWTFSTHPAGLDHTQLANIGVNTHAQIDTHISNADIHIDHTAVSIIAGTLLTGGGTIDGNVTLSVDEASIDHGSITGLGDDDHTQYLLASGVRNLAGDLTLDDAVDFILNTTTGTKIGTASTQKLGLWGATPVVRPSAYTQTYSTADKTLGAYTPDDESGAYSGIDNAQAGTVYAQVADLNALRVAYENLRAFVEDGVQMLNSVVDDLQTIGAAG